MAFACVAYLYYSFDLVDDGVADSMKVLQILNCLHGFHTYAMEHWLQHLLPYFRDIGAMQGAPSSPLHNLIERLVKRHDELLEMIQQRAPGSLSPYITESPSYQAFLQGYFTFRESLSKKTEETGESAPQSLNSSFDQSLANYRLEMDSLRQRMDPTLFSTIGSAYQEILHKILQGNSYQLDRETVARFGQKHQASAYICRYPDCLGRSRGFASSQARQDHESLRHGQGIVCNEPACLRSRVGFSNSESLKRHRKESHLSEQLPHRFKRTKMKLVSNDLDIATCHDDQETMLDQFNRQQQPEAAVQLGPNTQHPPALDPNKPDLNDGWLAIGSASSNQASLVPLTASALVQLAAGGNSPVPHGPEISGSYAVWGSPKSLTLSFVSDDSIGRASTKAISSSYAVPATRETELPVPFLAPQIARPISGTSEPSSLRHILNPPNTYSVASRSPLISPQSGPSPETTQHSAIFPTVQFAFPPPLNQSGVIAQGWGPYSNQQQSNR